MKYLFLSLSKDIPAWWSKKSLEEQKAYLEKHPKSKMKLSKKLSGSGNPKLIGPNKPKAKLEISDPLSLDSIKNSLDKENINSDKKKKMQAYLGAKKKKLGKSGGKLQKPQISNEKANKIKELVGEDKEKEAELFELGVKVGIAKLLSKSTFATVDSHNKWSERSYKSWYKSLTKDEAEALADYKDLGYEEINYFARTGNDYRLENHSLSDIKDVLKSMDSALNKSRTDRDLTVFRGLSHINFNNEKEIQKLMNHGLQDNGYMSVATAPRAALGFIGKEGNSVVLAINLPKGSKAGSINKGLAMKNRVKVTNAEETELLLPRRSKIIPTRIEKLEKEDQPPAFIVHAEILIP